MAGAVSAGAYTAGVLDFLIEALDAWYDERAAQQQQHGNDAQSWTVPTHDVLLQALTGASAGGMCAAISAVALKEVFDHVHETDPSGAINRLYQSWVRTIDIVPLLGSEDLPKGEGPVKSILDSTPIDAIANTALTIDATRFKSRPWVADPLGIILTLSNLRGIPYSVDNADQGSFEERINYHADRIQFNIARQGAASSPTTIGLNYSDPNDPNWNVLRTAAMATGAFPIMLAARVIQRTQTDYESRLWEISNTSPSATGECDSEQTITPDWAATVKPAFENVYADGGITNNNPFECARQYLVDAAGNANGHNPREPEKANAAVISVAPFPGNEPFDPNYDAEQNSALGKVASAVLGTLISQSRFQGEDLKLTQDPGVSSRYAIAPSDSTAPRLPSLLSAPLGAFGGFIDQKFRDRDYQLGRRNCQQFLRVQFMLPESNPLIAEGIAGKRQLIDGIRQKVGDEWWYQIIPLMPSLQAEIQAPRRDEFKTTQERLNQVAKAAANRLETVVHGLVDEQGDERIGWWILIKLIFDAGGKGKIEDLILQTLESQLEKNGQV